MHVLSVTRQYSAGEQEGQVVVGDYAGRCGNDRRYRGDRRHGGDGQAEHDVVVDRLAVKVRRGLETQRASDRWPALDRHRVAEVHRPGRFQGLAFGPYAADLDHLALLQKSLPPDVDARDATLSDGPVT